MAKINFSAQQQAELDTFLLQKLYNGDKIKGSVGASNLTVYDLVHNTTPTGLRDIRNRIDNEAEKLEKLRKDDELTEWDERKLRNLRADSYGITLLIKQIRAKAQAEADARDLNEMEAEVKELVKANKSPAELIAELQQKIEAKKLAMA